MNVKIKNNNYYMGKEQNGITLIALAVTIILLLVLASVSISMLTGQNGILNKTNEAKKNSQVANEKESIIWQC